MTHSKPCYSVAFPLDGLEHDLVVTVCADADSPSFRIRDLHDRNTLTDDGTGNTTPRNKMGFDEFSILPRHIHGEVASGSQAGHTPIGPSVGQRGQ